MNCLVTGAAGFIGSHLSRRLLQQGFSVTGIDSFTDYYSRNLKEANLAPLLQESSFKFMETDILESDLDDLIGQQDCIYHLAAQAGVRASWGSEFSTYTKNNVEATQKLLESAKNTSIKKFIYASSSSVYGDSPDLPMRETSPLFPYSPYGVSKLAAEHLCGLYFRNYGVPAVSLRFFTVYGPGQRPDMAFHKFFKAIVAEEPITVFGDGTQTRDFTYIDDIVEANFSALTNGHAGEIYNIGGGHQKKLAEIFPLLEDITSQKVKIDWQSKQKGDVLHTLASIKKAEKDLLYAPKTELDLGLHKEWEWIQSVYKC